MPSPVEGLLEVYEDMVDVYTDHSVYLSNGSSFLPARLLRQALQNDLEKSAKGNSDNALIWMFFS